MVQRTVRRPYMHQNIFIRRFAKRANLTNKDAQYVYQKLIDEIRQCLLDGERIYLAGVGSFELVPFRHNCLKNFTKNNMVMEEQDGYWSVDAKGSLDLSRKKRKIELLKKQQQKEAEK